MKAKAYAIMLRGADMVYDLLWKIIESVERHRAKTLKAWQAARAD